MKSIKNPTGPACQSCGLSNNLDQKGTEKDGTLSDDYCCDCYESGEFIEPEITIKEMIERLVPSTTKSRDLTMEEASTYLGTLLPTLKRWS